MNKKTLTALLAFASALCLCFNLSACSLSGTGGSIDQGGDHGGSQGEQQGGEQQGGDHGGSQGGGQGGEGHTHHFEYVYNNDATCTEDGTETERCECGARGETRVKEGSKLGHDMVQLAAQTATCSECGYPAHIGCSRCGYTEEDITYTDALHVHYTLLEGHYSVTGLNGECTDSEIKIPSAYKGHPVTSIGNYAFSNSRSLKSIIVPENVTSIKSWAFEYCSSLSSITIPTSVTSIGEDAFEGCNALNAVYITNLAAWGGIDFGRGTANPLHYAHHLYVDGQEVKELHIPDGVTKIKSSAFEGCSSLTSITIPESVTSIERGAFFRCESLTSITIPNNVTSIGAGAFSGCSSLTSINIPDGVTSIGNAAFSGTAFYENDANWINDILYIGDYLIRARETISGACNIREGTKLIANSTFQDCRSLSSVTIPESVTEIGMCAFQDCRSLSSVTIPEGVTEIGMCAFQDCRSLSSVTIPEGVTTIEYEAFENCSSLKSIIIPESVTKIGSPIAADSFGLCSGAFEGCVSLENVTFEEDSQLTLIGVRTFQGCSMLTNIIIPASVTSIGESAFNGCSSLQNITIPDGMTSIGESAFEGCSSLQNITIPDGMTSIGWGAFAGTAFYENDANWINDILYIGEYLISARETISSACNIRGGTKLIADGAFWQCSSFTSVTIPESVTSIGEGAFKGCSSLENITIPLGVTSIGGYVFQGCESLTSVTFNGESKLTSIGERAFYECSSLTSIIIPESVTEIGKWTFDGCSSLNAVYITDLTAWCDIEFKVGNDYGYNSTSNPLSYAHHLYVDGQEVKDLCIPDGITGIKKLAFCGGAFTSIVIPESVTSISDMAFFACNSLEKVYYGGTKKDWASIYIDSNYNSDLTEATWYYFSDGEPSEEQWAESENWWHFDEETGEAVEWKKENQ